MSKRRPTFGLRLPLVQGPIGLGWEDQGPPETVTKIARKADELGYELLAAGEHIAIPTSEIGKLGGRWLDPFATLAHVAAVTTNIRLLTAITVASFRHPLATFKAASSVDWLSNGRVILGIGTGWNPKEYAALDVDFSVRGATTTDHVTALNVLRNEPVASYEGTHVRFEDISAAPFAVQRPFPLWVAGASKAAIRRAATLADGWLLSSADADDDVRIGLEFAATLPEFAGKAEEFVVTAPILPLGGVPAILGATPEASRRPSSEAAEACVREIERRHASGVTNFRANFVTESESEYLEAVEWFATDVMRTLSDENTGS